LVYLLVVVLKFNPTNQPTLTVFEVGYRKKQLVGVYSV
jgi:hypothetical protein